MADPVASTMSDVKAGIKHPIALFLFGMLFAAFLFPMIAVALGKLKAKGGIWGTVVPGKFTSAPTGT